VKRHELEHIIRAASAITGANEIVVIGSQAVLGQYPDAPAEFLVSREADVFSFRSESDSELIDGSIGENTIFHQTFGYYAHDVAEQTAHLPAGWKERLIRVQNENTGTGAGLCLEAHDLAVSKLIAGREKDMSFVRGLVEHRMVDLNVVKDRLETVMIDEQRKQAARERLGRWTKR
jgi:hypothetical protein